MKQSAYEFIIVCRTEKEGWEHVTSNLLFTFGARVNDIIWYAEAHWRVALR